MGVFQPVVILKRKLKLIMHFSVSRMKNPNDSPKVIKKAVAEL